MKFLISTVLVIGLFFQANASEGSGRVIKVYPSLVGERAEGNQVPVDEISNSPYVLEQAQALKGSVDGRYKAVEYQDETGAVSAAYFINKGWLKENIERLSKDFGVILLWHKKIPSCVDWSITADYQIPSTEMMEAFAYVLSEYDLIPKYHRADNVMQILSSRDYKECSDE